MDTRVQSLLFASILSLTLTIAMALRKDARSYINKLFIIFSGSVSFWYISRFFTLWLKSDLWYRIQLIFGGVVPVTAIYFFHNIIVTTNPTSLFFRYFSKISILFITIIVVIALSPFYKLKLFPILIGVVSALMLYFSFYRLYKASFYVTSKVEATRISYLVFGGVVTVTFSIFDFLPALGVKTPPLGYVLTLMYLYVLSQSIIRNRLFDIYELISRFAVLSALAITLSFIFLGLLFWVDPHTPEFVLNTIIASLVVLLLFEPLHEKVEEKINKLLIKERKKLLFHIEEISRKIAHLLDLKEIIKVLEEGLKATGRVTHAVLYILEPEADRFKRYFSLGTPSPPLYLELATIRFIIEKLKKEMILSREQLELEVKFAYSKDELASATTSSIALGFLNELNSDLLFLIKEEEVSLGIFGVRDERIKDPYAPEEINMFKNLVAQIGIAIENSKLYQKLKERDRLVTLGELSSGLAHEIRNPLVAIKGASEILRSICSEEEVKSFTDIIIEESKRINKVVSAFLDYSKKEKEEIGIVDPVQVVQHTIKTLEAMDIAREVDIGLQLKGNIPKVKGDPDKLHQVLMNISINGIEAMNGKGRLSISVSYNSSVKRVLIRIADTGPGIPEDLLDKVFIPFFTTKPNGTGLGLPISQKIITHWGGDIRVFNNEDGIGAVFVVELVAAESLD